jgi:hypothetical protein
MGFRLTVRTDCFLFLVFADFWRIVRGKTCITIWFGSIDNVKLSKIISLKKDFFHFHHYSRTCTTCSIFHANNKVFLTLFWWCYNLNINNKVSRC